MIRLLVSSAMFAALAAPALAVQPTRAEMQKACKADYDQFCAGTMPGGGRILKCLKKHESELTPACQKVMEEMG